MRCTPAAKQNVVPAGLELTIEAASWPGLITTPLHGPATAGPASSELTAGGLGSLGSTGFVVVVVEDVGFRVGPGFVDGVGTVEVAVGLVARGAGVEPDLPGRCEGSTRPAACSDSWNFAVVVALFSLAITGTATATTVSAPAPSATDHNFLNALLLGAGSQEQSPRDLR